MIQTIFFDLDDTLLDFHQAEAVALRKTLLSLDIEPTEETVSLYSAINSTQWELLEQGKITREQLLTRRFDLLFERLGIERSSFQAQKTYEKQLSTGHYFIPGAPQILELLAPAYDLYLVSNGTSSVQAGRIQSAGIAPYFKDIFISQKLGFNKPRREFFDLCFGTIPDFSRATAVIIGDSLTSDMQGGNNAGIHTCWFNPHKKPRRADIPVEFEISRLKQIPAVLKEFENM